ncbi:hypothetical protein ACFLYI_00870, partial [Chloroflexota bacterium]
TYNGPISVISQVLSMIPETEMPRGIPCYSGGMSLKVYSLPPIPSSRGRSFEGGRPFMSIGRTKSFSKTFVLPH